MYIERADILYSVRSVTFNPFIDEIFALPFDSLAAYPSKTLY